MRGAEHTRTVTVAALLVFAAQMAFYLPYVTDDGYIYARFAENLAARGELAFNPGEPVHAATSPLWAALGAGGVLLGFEAHVFLKWLGMGVGAVAVLVFARAARRWLGRGGWVGVTVVLMAVEPWFVRWSASGMETPLAVLLLVAMIEAGARREEAVAWRRVGWTAGVLPLVRPEAMLLLALVVLAVSRSPVARRRWGVWAGLLLPGAIWAAWAMPTYGHVLPATLQAKSTPLGMEPARLFANLRVLVSLYALALALPALGWLWGAVRRLPRIGSRSGRWIEPVLWAWTLSLPLVYLMRDVQVVSRYLEIVLPAVLLLGTAEVAGRVPSRPGTAVWMAQVSIALLLTAAWIGPNARAFGRSLQAGLGEIATWIAQNSDPGATVAIYDIGLVGYRSERRILDLGGLVHPGINDLRNRVDDADILHEGLFLRFGRPDFLVDRDARPAVLAGRLLAGEVRCDPVLHREVANLGLSRAQPVIYTLYRLVPAD